MTKLHLGCGKKYIPGWINIDIVAIHPDVKIDDVSELQTIKDGSIDLIYASHVLEHFGRHEVEDVLKIWNKKLTQNGLIRLSVPDFESVCKRYLQTYNIAEVLGLVSGGQRSIYDYHKVVFDFNSLSLLLQKCGFTNARRYNWAETEHNLIDDFSQAYLPHMDKENGMLMSLNVEANKQTEVL